ncbi:MAG TPA: hypothetical protein VFN67_37510 [Polyangiales bacterium]|nr:hypothetical protein [Polyangiales bacterium]
MANNDYVSEILNRVAGEDDDVAGDDDLDVAGDDEIGLDSETESYIAGEIAGLVEVGALTEVGAKKARKVIRKATLASRAGKSRPAQQRAAARPQARPQTQGAARMPSNQFQRSTRETERRAPLGFTEDGTGRNYFSLAATIGATTTMRAKVSRAAHVDRLLIVPSASGVTVQSIQVGDEEQVLAPGVPAELYGPSALNDSLSDNFSPIGPGLDFVITLKNTVAAAITGTIGTKCTVYR